MTDEPKPKNSRLKDTILFILLLPVAAITIPVTAVVGPILLGLSKLFGKKSK
jgi:hypothetical protein